MKYFFILFISLASTQGSATANASIQPLLMDTTLLSIGHAVLGQNKPNTFHELFKQRWLAVKTSQNAQWINEFEMRGQLAQALWNTGKGNQTENQVCALPSGLISALEILQKINGLPAERKDGIALAALSNLLWQHIPVDCHQTPIAAPIPTRMQLLQQNITQEGETVQVEYVLADTEERLIQRVKHEVQFSPEVLSALRQIASASAWPGKHFNFMLLLQGNGLAEHLVDMKHWVNASLDDVYILLLTTGDVDALREKIHAHWPPNEDKNPGILADPRDSGISLVTLIDLRGGRQLAGWPVADIAKIETQQQLNRLLAEF